MKFLVLALFPALALGQLPGGTSDTTVSATYEPVVFAVQAINNQFAASNGGQSPNLALLEVVKAKTQVVQGQNLFLTLHLTGDYYCDVTVWYRSWLKGDDRIQVTDGPKCHKGQQAARALAGGVGQPKPLDSTTEQIVNDALNFAVCASHDRSNAMFASVLGDTSGVTYTQQVTAGMTYRFQNVPLLETHCRNVGCAALDLTSCKANAHGMKSTCSFTVQSQPWMKPALTLSEMNCSS